MLFSNEEQPDMMKIYCACNRSVKNTQYKRTLRQVEWNLYFKQIEKRIAEC